MNIFSWIKQTEKAFSWRRHRARDAARIHLASARGTPPVVVYSMPKTASAAVYAALRRTRGILALKSHTLRPEHWRARRLDAAWNPGWTGVWRDHWHSDELVHRMIIGQRRPCRFIALVRDPVATNTSAFAYFPRNWFGDLSTPPDLTRMTPESVEAAFFDRYPHHVTTDWFDLEPAVTLGIDVYATPFDHARGWATYRNGPFELLVLRTELPDTLKSERINAFLGTTSVRVARENTSDQHGTRRVSDELRARLAHHPAYINGLIDHKFTAHFWSPAEREAMRSRWLTTSRTRLCPPPVHAA